LKISDDSSIGAEFEVPYYNKMFDEINKHYTTDDVLEYMKYYSESMLEYILDFVRKKDNAGHSVEYSHFVMLVVYPQLVKNVKSKGDWEKIDRIKLMMVAHDAAYDSMIKNSIGPFNRYRLLRTFHTMPHKTFLTFEYMKRKLPEFVKIFDELHHRQQGVDNINIYKTKSGPIKLKYITDEEPKKQEIIEYLKNLKEKFKTNENLYQAYKMKKNQITEIGNATSQKGLNEVINEKIDKLVEEEIDYVIKVFYNISIKDKEPEPISVMCLVSPIINGKLSINNTLSAVIKYTIEELEKYKLKKGDFKLIVKGLLNKSIESDVLKKYTRISLIN